MVRKFGLMNVISDMVEIEILENVQKEGDGEREQMPETGWTHVENVNTENKLGLSCAKLSTA